MIDVARAQPLASTVEGISAINDYLNVQLGPPAGEGWIAATDLVADGSPRREELQARIQTRHKTTDRHFVAMTFFGASIWQVVVAGIASYLTTLRVPELKPANVALHWNADGWGDTLALVEGRFAALPDDPAAGHPDVTVVADRNALRAYFVEHIVRDYVPPLIDLVSATSPLGKRALWGVVADRCVGTLIWLAKELNQTAICLAEVDALHQTAPFTGKSGILTVEHGTHQELFLKRNSCCLSYKVPEQIYCSTCPLLPLEDRIQRLQAYVAKDATV